MKCIVKKMLIFYFVFIILKTISNISINTFPLTKLEYTEKIRSAWTPRWNSTSHISLVYSNIAGIPLQLWQRECYLHIYIVNNYMNITCNVAINSLDDLYLPKLCYKKSHFIDVTGKIYVKLYFERFFRVILYICYVV